MFAVTLIDTITMIHKLPSLEQTKTYIVLGFSALVATAFLVTLISMVVFRYKDPNADISVWLNVFLTCLGYVVGILTGLLGIPLPPNGGG